MKKGVKISLILLFLAFTIFSLASFALSAEHGKKISSNVLSALENDDSVRVIIQTSGEEIKGKKIFKNTFAAELTSQEIAALNEDPGIKKIELDEIKHIFLSDSAGIINATNTWAIQVSGINLTGIGQTVCVLDTGINYSHPDLSGKVIAEYCYCNVSGSACCPGSQAEAASGLDDYGHGTHVAGIIAANGTIKGIAPGAKLISIKVCNSAGSCSNSDIISGINWCVNNASLYNISVISMSLGGGEYDEYCDANQSSFANVINEAVGKNITVVVASGNNKTGETNLTKIASPACIQNATAVTSTNKTDSISSFSKRNALVKLAAPGTDINSTYLTGYAALSGTSMAAPHVAAAVAILQQAKKLQSNAVYTPSEIVSILQSNGKKINDSEGQGLNFSRINIYDSIDYFIEIESSSQPVECHKKSPANSTYSSSSNMTFEGNATSDAALQNMTLYVWNSTNNLIITNTTGIAGAFNSTNWTYSFNDSSYKWNIQACDNSSGCNFSTSNFSLTIDTIKPMTYLSIDDTSITTSETAMIYCNATDVNLDSLTLYVAGAAKNSSSTNSTSLNFTYVYSPASAGTKEVSCNASDKASNINSSSGTITVTSSGGGSSGDDNEEEEETSDETVTSEEEESDSYSKLYASITADREMTISPNSATISSTGVSEISFTSSINAINVKFKVSPLSKPEEKLNNTYKYFSIELTAPDDRYLSAAEIVFEVKKSWLETNDYLVNTTKLNRYHDNEWSALNTSLSDESNDYYIFKAETPGFSEFAITAESENETVIENLTLADQTGLNQTSGNAAKFPSKTTIYIGGAILALAILAGIIYLIFYLTIPKGHDRFHPKA